jgi:hypothetical protein
MLPLLSGLFTNPIFLPGVLAAGLPVLIHLLSRQRAREIYFPTIRFLQLTAERTASRRRIEEILLLALRAIALACVALALAGPVLNSWSSLAGRDSLSAIVIVDNSMSMQQDAAGRKTFERAKETALELVSQFPSGSRWALWLACAQGEDDQWREIRARPADAKTAAEKMIVATDGTADLAKLLLAAGEKLAREKTPARELYLLTDRQASSWDAVKNDENPARGQARIFVCSLQSGGKDNWGISDLSLRARAPLPGEIVTVEADVSSNLAAEARTAVSLYVDGKCLERRSVTLPPSGGTEAVVTRVRFAFPLEQSGWCRGLVQVDSDSCDRDNRRYFAFKVRKSVNILLAEGDSGLLPRERASYYLSAALAPLSRGIIRPVIVIPGDLSSRDFALFDAVFLLDVPDLDNETVSRLKQYVNGGGVLVFMPGGEVSPEKWEQLFGEKTDNQGGLLPGKISSLVTLPADGARLEAGEAGHPLLASFAAAAEHLRRGRVYKIFGIEIGERSPARVALALDGGNTFLATKTYGSGHAILWAAPPKPTWTNLQGKPVFVPLIHAHAYLALGFNGRESFSCGVPLPLKEYAGAEAELRCPGDKTERVKISAASPFYAHTWQAGLYEAGDTVDEEKQTVFAVNPPATESDLTQIDAGLLQSLLSRRGETILTDSQGELQAEVSRLRTGKSFATPLLIVALLALLLEALHGSRRVADAGSMPNAQGTGE